MEISICTARVAQCTPFNFFLFLNYSSLLLLLPHPSLSFLASAPSLLFFLLPVTVLHPFSRPSSPFLSSPAPPPHPSSAPVSSPLFGPGTVSFPPWHAPHPSLGPSLLPTLRLQHHILSSLSPPHSSALAPSPPLPGTPLTLPSASISSPLFGLGTVSFPPWHAPHPSLGFDLLPTLRPQHCLLPSLTPPHSSALAPSPSLLGTPLTLPSASASSPLFGSGTVSFPSWWMAVLGTKKEETKAEGRDGGRCQ